MPGKSRKGRGKPSARSRKRHGAVTRAVQQPAVAKTYEPVVPAPALSDKPESSGAPTGVRYPYTGKELRRIGILAGIMLAILIVLALALPQTLSLW